MTDDWRVKLYAELDEAIRKQNERDKAWFASWKDDHPEAFKDVKR